MNIAYGQMTKEKDHKGQVIIGEMKSDKYSHFDLRFPGYWIEGRDRDWASQNRLVLMHIENLFTEAVAAYSRFQPITSQNYRDFIDKDRYEKCFNGIYAKSIVFALDGIEKLLCRLCEQLNPPEAVVSFCKEYSRQFGHLKHIRDSAIHIEDRGRGVTRSQKPLDTNIVLLGSFIGNSFIFTGEDGQQYEVEISERTINRARKIIQNIIDAYTWS